MLGSRLKALRKEKSITQKELSKHLGVSDRTVGYYETDERFPPADVLIKIADYFDISLDALFDRDNIYRYSKSYFEANLSNSLNKFLKEEDYVIMHDPISGHFYYISRIDLDDERDVSIFEQINNIVEEIYSLSTESQKDLAAHMKLLKLRDMQKRNQSNSDSLTSEK